MVKLLLLVEVDGIVLESILQQKIVQMLRKDFAALTYKIDASAHRGIPDLLVVLPAGITIFLEIKTAKGRLSPLQARTIAELETRDAKVFVVRSVEEAKKVVDVVVKGE
jgi:hypothetical protein